LQSIIGRHSTLRHDALMS